MTTRMVAGRYRLLGELGRGGMGVVWRARDEVLGREVAIKEVRAPDGLDDHEVRRLYARLEGEGRAAARVSHPNVITVYDVAMAEGSPWIVMELVRGLSLSDILDADGSLTPRRAAEIGGRVLAALRVAHERGVLHRDVKPGNVLIGNDGRIVLTDFGIAVIEGTSALTRTGEVVGSPEYLAPERALGRATGPESDLWSLGVLLYVAVEGGSPFRRDTALNTLRAVVDEPLPEPRHAGPLAPVIAGLLRKDPSERMTGPDAQRMLDAVAAGRAPYTPTAPTAPTVALLPSPPPAALASATAVSDTAAAAPPPRRAVVAMAAGVLALALAAAGLAWALLGDDAGGASSANGPSAASSAAPSTTPTSSAPTTASPTPTASSSTTPPPALHLTVIVSATRDTYTGPCPPPDAAAPSFSAVITVSRTPATVTYRWRTHNGGSSDPAWKTAHFAAGDPTSRTVTHTELSHPADYNPSTDWIAVDVNQPLTLQSNHVPFTVTCESPSPSASSPSASPTA
ncbi:MAG: eukaryotic-like serine/threonine-protein kinase [Streptomyces sp.]|nr:eukaryotic-like serine/threonine-protein kinase [Streptomyces sp.]